MGEDDVDAGPIQKKSIVPGIEASEVNSTDETSEKSTLKEEHSMKSKTKKETKQNKTEKQKPEISVESDGTFSKPKLKKADPVNRQIDGPKVEKVRLMHHEFENEPQFPVLEEKTDVQLSMPVCFEKDSKTGTKVAIKKKKKKMAKQVDLKQDSDSDSPYFGFAAEQTTSVGE